MEQRRNRRGYEENYISATHVKIDDLTVQRKEVVAQGEYVMATIPNYPHPVEFHTSTIAHETNARGAEGILQNGGFRAFNRNLLWWFLKFNSVEIPEEDELANANPNEDEAAERARHSREIAAAEQRYLEQIFPDITEEEKRRQERFLYKFTSSPVFKDESRFGNFRFSFPLEEVLHAYSTQFCGGNEAILRVFETVVYNREIMYSVLVHSPDVHDYDELELELELEAYPELGDNEEGVCAYRDGEIIWRAQAIPQVHRMELRIDRNQKHIQATDIGDWEGDVWDIVALALHIPEGMTFQITEFPVPRLLDALSACGPDYPPLNFEMMRLPAAEGKVKEFKATFGSGQNSADEDE